jgi:hypothetical protein
MKYGILWINKQLDTSLPVNIGNEIQHYYSIKELLLEMEVSPKDIVSIKNSERASLKYDGDKIIHPINEAMFTIGVGNDRKYSRIFPLPECIMPVFIALSLVGRTELYPEAIKYFERWQPIGARDEYTMNLLRKHGIESYLFGCISVTQPLRINPIEADKIFVVDVPDKLWDKIPLSIAENPYLIKDTHMFPNELHHDNAPARRYRFTEGILKKYRSSARLVITAKLHCALPCIGMGIPVILATENHSSRFGWIDKHLPIYTTENWDKIDWNPFPIEMESIKKLMRRAAKNRILSTCTGCPCDFGLLREINDYWLLRPSYDYDNFAGDVIRQEIKNFPRNLEYIIWGCGLVGEQTYQAMQKYFPEGRFVGAIDSFVAGYFHNMPIQPPDAILDFPNAIVLAATYTGRDAVINWMNAHDKISGKDYISLATTSG